MYDTRTLLNENTCSLFRDSEDSYRVLERLFGTMTVGMAFGESGFLTPGDNKARFYNAIALSECVCLTISKKDFQLVIE